MVALSAPFVVVLALLTCPAAAGASHANPIRKVVTLLQKMQDKVIAEGEKEQKLFDAFMCQCKTGSADLSASIAAANDKLPQSASDIEKKEEERTQTKEDVTQAQADRVSANTAVAEATEMRKKEAAAFADTNAEYVANLGAIAKAVASMEKGTAGAFLQSAGAQTVQKLAQGSSTLFEDDREKLLSFLGQRDAEEAPSTLEVVGILKTMADEMTAGKKDTVAAEQAAISAYQELCAAKKKELAALQKAIEEKLKQTGDLSIEIAQMRNDQTDTEEALVADQKFLAGMAEKCKTKSSEFDARTKTRGEELEALADTIKMLNSDDALELFKKTLPGAASSLLQVQVDLKAMRARALAELRKGPRRVKTDLIALALRGKATGFEKVVKMIDDMVASLKTEQTDDDNKKEYCAVQFDHSDDARKSVERSVADEEKAIAVTSEGIQTTREEITALKRGLASLDKAVADATVQRQEENADFKDLMASDGAAKELIGMAKNRMQKFYNPKLATLAQISAHVQHTTASAVEDSKEDSSGVLSMMDALTRDLDKEMTEAEAEEKNGQADYETMMKDSSAKRSADAKSLTEKESTKAELEEALESHKEAHTDATKELAATMEFISSLHLECDFLMKHFDMRKEARASEVDSLGKAKAVLSGADYSLVQTESRRYLRRA